MQRAAELETTALGAAFLAGLATGVWRTPAEACATADAPALVTPACDAATRAERRAAWRRTVERARERGAVGDCEAGGD